MSAIAQKNRFDAPSGGDRGFAEDPLDELTRLLNDPSVFGADQALPPRQPEPAIPDFTAGFEAELFQELRASIDPQAGVPPVRSPVVAAPEPRVEPGYNYEPRIVATEPDAEVDLPFGAFEPAAPTTARSAPLPPRFDIELPEREEPSFAPVAAPRPADMFDPAEDAAPAFVSDTYQQSYQDQPGVTYSDPDGYDPAYQPPYDPNAGYGVDPYDPRQFAESRGYDPTRYQPAEDDPYDALPELTPQDLAPAVKGPMAPALHNPEYDGYRDDPQAGPDGALPEHRPYDDDAAQSPKRGMLLAGVALALVVVGGLGFLGFRAFSGPSTGGVAGQPPVIHADGKPNKTLPDPSQQPQEPQQQAKLDYERVGTKPADGKIVERQEEPVEQVSGKNVRVILPGGPSAPVGTEATADDGSRKVRTVVVRPDGSIVPPNAPAPAPAAVAVTPAPVPVPAATPVPVAVAPVPVAPAAPAPAAVAAVKAPAPPPIVATTPTPPAFPAAPVTPTAKVVTPPQPQLQAPAGTKPTLPAVAAPQAPKPVAVAPIAPIAPPAPALKPPAKPSTVATGAPLALVPSGPAPASAAPTPVATAPVAAAPAAPVASGGGSFMIQLSSHQSEAEARSAYAAAQRRYSAINGMGLNVQPADLGARGTFYRVRVGPVSSREEAVRVCEQIKGQGGSCLIAGR
ncbi:MAG: SPOR domain-containing protein [Hyphomicrobiaceae bacterium]|nr:SPOR domain-containing protein [Hyphomicrobiaceae bacterium]